MLSLNNLPNPAPHEKTELFLRRHWFELVVLAVYAIVLLVLPILIGLGLQSMESQLLSSEFFGPVVAVFLGIYLLFVAVIIITQFTDYYLDTWIITNERIINIEQHGLFSRVISELHLADIQDVTSETTGFLSTFFSFGDVYIQTAAERERFNFKNVDNPDEVKEKIIKLARADQQRHPPEDYSGTRMVKNKMSE